MATSSKPRQAKTDQQRATERLGIAQRRHDKATAEVTKLEKTLNGARAEQAAAKERLDYAKADPALKTPAEHIRDAGATTRSTSTPGATS